MPSAESESPDETFFNDLSQQGTDANDNNAVAKQVETLLKTQESTEQTREPSRPDSTTAYVASTAQQPLPNSNEFLGPPEAPPRISPVPDVFVNTGTSPEGEFQWEMIGLGLDEPLPPQDVQDEL
ncbi:uncharacterized protein N0V89_005015 [Didymosphaeria variabile]|uniref:Uncharacterized protein n=1 Tax=Didymosphaeria variabile TaxID=1932322 RepID=A0A9W9CBC8_9PLEO|nr:uncharacterized protein N0V89_005015 [Didymosphaeria variabile]KAJ4353288.1 hypothetical protein N0V89_005015 [Didymosphaeria variabile]